MDILYLCGIFVGRRVVLPEISVVFCNLINILLQSKLSLSQSSESIVTTAAIQDIFWLRTPAALNRSNMSCQYWFPNWDNRSDWLIRLAIPLAFANRSKASSHDPNWDSRSDWLIRFAIPPAFVNRPTASSQDPNWDNRSDWLIRLSTPPFVNRSKAFSQDPNWDNRSDWLIRLSTLPVFVNRPIASCQYWFLWSRNWLRRSLLLRRFWKGWFSGSTAFSGRLRHSPLARSRH